jgi:MoxR-like ATPase
MTSNGEREFPAPFLRRCLRLKLDIPQNSEALFRLVLERFGSELDPWMKQAEAIINLYLDDVKDGKKRHSVDQLLNAMHLLLRGTDLSAKENEALRCVVFSNLAD